MIKVGDFLTKCEGWHLWHPDSQSETLPMRQMEHVYLLQRMIARMTRCKSKVGDLRPPYLGYGCPGRCSFPVAS